MKVRAPGGQTYRVTRRWVPWQRKSRRLSLDGFDVPVDPPSGDDPISAILLLAILPFAIGSRAVYGRHWTVEVRRGFTPIHEERAGSWTASGVRIK